MEIRLITRRVQMDLFMMFFSRWEIRQLCQSRFTSSKTSINSISGLCRAIKYQIRVGNLSMELNKFFLFGNHASLYMEMYLNLAGLNQTSSPIGR